MAQDLQKFDEAYDRLLTYGSILLNVAAERRKEIHGCLDGSVRLPSGCPGKASGAELVYRGVKEALDEVKAAVRDVEAAMWEVKG